MAYPIKSILTGAGMALAAAPGQGGVVASSDAGFVVQASVDVALAPDAAYALLAEPGRWWNSAHTYSGDARNMVLEAKAGGCFCETLPDKSEKGSSGSIEHARVIYAAPGQRLRLSGALGPLQSSGGEGGGGSACAAAAARGGKGLGAGSCAPRHTRRPCRPCRHSSRHCAPPTRGCKASSPWTPLRRMPGRKTNLRAS
jgi:hypothetical protein